MDLARDFAIRRLILLFILSVGNNNDYWHPHASTIERLLNAGIRIFQTETGWLKSEFDGNVSVMNGNITIEVQDGKFSVQ